MKRITVVVDDKPGVLANLALILGNKNINIENIQSDEHDGISVIALEVDRYDEALLALKNASYCAFSEDVLILKLENKPGALAQISIRFKDADINMRSIRIIKQDGNFSIIAVSVERTHEAMKLVEDVLLY